MKNFVAITMLLVLSVTFNTWHLKANPFAYKKGKVVVKKRGKVVVKKRGKVVVKKKDQKKINLEFIGYAIMEDQRFAIVQLNNKQHILKKGESLGEIKIIRFSADSLTYQIGSIVRSVPINRFKP